MECRHWKATKLPTESVLMLVTLLGRLGANPEFWASITSAARSWGLKNAGSFDRFKSQHITGDAKLWLQSLSVPRSIKWSTSTCMSSCRRTDGGVGWERIPSFPRTPGPCLEETGCFGVIASGLFLPSSRCKLFRCQHQRSERRTGKKSQVNSFYSLGSSVQGALLALSVWAAFSHKTSL